MAGGSAKGRSGKRGGGARPKPARAAGKKPSAPVLGNDPFLRGAAPREPVTPEEAVPAPVAATAPEPAPEVWPPAAAPPEPPPRPTLAEAAASATAKLADVERRAEATLSGLEQRLQDLASRAGLGARDELRDVLARLLPALLSRAGALLDLVRLLEPPERLDAFGMDARLVERAAPLLEFLYATWWRVEARFLDRLPSTGPALVVANHGGTLPWDALMLRHALRRERPGRELRPLLDDRACDLPVFGPFTVRAGAVRASREAAEALLRAGTIVAAFPEGSAAARKPWTERYRIERFGRGGFAKIALRERAPIVPCAIVGAEEATPPIARPGWLAEVLGLPPLMASPALRFGAAGLIPLPSRWSIRFGEPIAPAGGPDAAEDPAAVLALTERVRETLQAMLDEDVAGRRSVFL